MIGTILQQLSEQDSIETSEEGLNINLDSLSGDSSLKRKLDRLGFDVELLNSAFEEFKGIVTSKLNHTEDDLLRIEKMLKYDEHEYFMTNNDVDLHKEFEEISERENNIHHLLSELLGIKHKEMEAKEAELREKEREQDLAAESKVTPEIIAKAVHEGMPVQTEMSDDVKRSIEELKEMIENMHCEGTEKGSGLWDNIKSGIAWEAGKEAVKRGAKTAWEGAKYVGKKVIENMKAGTELGIAYDLAQAQIEKREQKIYAEDEVKTRKRLGLAEDVPVTKEQVTQTRNLERFEQEQLKNEHWKTSGKASDTMLKAIMGPETASTSLTDPKGFIFTRITPDKNDDRHSTAYGPFQITKSFFESNINRNELTEKEKDYYDRLISAQRKMLKNSMEGNYNDPTYGYGKSGGLGDTQEDRELYYKLAEKAVANSAKNFKSYEQFIQSYRGKTFEEDPKYFAKIDNFLSESGTSGEEVFKRLKNPALDVSEESKTRPERTDRENKPIDLSTKEEPKVQEESKAIPERTDRENKPIDLSTKEEPTKKSHLENDTSSNFIGGDEPKAEEEPKTQPQKFVHVDADPIEINQEEPKAKEEPKIRPERTDRQGNPIDLSTKEEPKAIPEPIQNNIPDEKPQVNVVPVQPVINQQVSQASPQREVHSAPSSKDPDIRNSEATLMNILYSNLNIHSSQELNRQLA